MKLHEIFETEERLDEGFLHKIAAAALMAINAISPSQLMKDSDVDMSNAIKLVYPAKTDNVVDKFVQRASNKYKVNPEIVKKAVRAALKYQHHDFPTAKDILAVVGTESSFNPNAKSALAKDPAIGLMQVRPGVWKLKAKDLSTIDDQIRTGAQILRNYYEKLGSREAALHAYNVGLKNHRTKSVVNPRYVPKVDKDKKLYQDI